MFCVFLLLCFIVFCLLWVVLFALGCCVRFDTCTLRSLRGSSKLGCCDQVNKFSGCTSLCQEPKTIQLKIILLIEGRSFNNLMSFISLNVSNNKRTCIEQTLIGRMQNPILLSVMNNPFKYFDGMLFSKLPFKLLETNDHRLCCIFPLYDDCSYLKSWCVYCCNLLRNSCVQTVFITNCLLVVYCILSTSAQIISIHRKKHTSQTGAPGKKANICVESNVTCINMCGILFAAYLCIIWVPDLAHSSTFVWVGEKWRVGVFCFLSFALVLMFSFVSPLLFSILASTRFDAVHQPLTTKFKEIKYVLTYSQPFSNFLFLVVTSLTSVTYFVHNSVPLSLFLPLANPLIQEQYPICHVESHQIEVNHAHTEPFLPVFPWGLHPQAQRFLTPFPNWFVQSWSLQCPREE